MITDKQLMQIAWMVGESSTCDRGSVGAVIVREGRCIAWGYNGSPPGMTHCSENNHGWVGHGDVDVDKLGCRNATHAEANAIAFAARQGISTAYCALYVTHHPCLTCSRLIIASGITSVHFQVNHPRDQDEAKDLLLKCGITLFNSPL